jgi:hypothetical protein
VEEWRSTCEFFAFLDQRCIVSDAAASQIPEPIGGFIGFFEHDPARLPSLRRYPEAACRSHEPQARPLLNFSTFPQSVLENLVGRELQLHVPGDVRIKRRRGRESDQFALDHRNPMAFGQRAHGVEHAAHPRHAVVRQVHRDLDNATSGQGDAHRFDRRQPAAALANGDGNGFGHVESIGGEVDVVGDERHPGTDGGRSSRGVGERRAEVRLPRSARHPGCEPFELSTADVLELPACGVRRGFLVQIHRNVEAPRDLRCRRSRQCHAVGHLDATNRHERHDIDRTQPGMLAAMRSEIDRGERHLEEGEHGVLNSDGVTRKRVHRAVVRGIGRHVEQLRARHALDGAGEPGDDLGPASFAYVGNAFDHRHGMRLLGEGEEVEKLKSGSHHRIPVIH